MKTIFAIIVSVLILNLGACNNSAKHQESTTGTPEQINRAIAVDVFDLKLSADPNAQLIDVRTQGEFAEGHLKNAINIDINSPDFETSLGKFDKTKPVLVYCLSGGRSAAAANKMQEMGFSEVYNMDGGILKWQNAGKPLVQGESKPSTSGMTMDDFNKAVSGDKYVMVDFSAVWCMPCQKMKPILESLADKKKDKLILIQIDADANKALLQQKGISGIPHLELYKDGKLVWKHEGYIDEDQLLSETKL